MSGKRRKAEDQAARASATSALDLVMEIIWSKLTPEEAAQFRELQEGMGAIVQQFKPVRLRGESSTPTTSFTTPQKIDFDSTTMLSEDRFRLHLDETTGIEERKKPGYTGDVMGDETAILHAASELLSRIYPRERVEKALEDLAAKAARENTARATAEPRPVRLDDAAKETTTPQAPAPVLAEWPSEKWKGSPEELSRKRYAIIAFLRRVWKPFIDDYNVLVTREILKQKDHDGGRALEGVLRSKDFPDLPDDLRILTSEQLRDFLAAQPVSVVNRDIRIGIADMS